MTSLDGIGGTPLNVIQFSSKTLFKDGDPVSFKTSMSNPLKLI